MNSVSCYITCKKTDRLINIVTIRLPAKAKLKGTKPITFKPKIKIKKINGKFF